MTHAKTKTKSCPAYDATKAKSYTERVKALFIERSTVNEDISQVCSEAKEDGCDPGMIRFAARELMMDDVVRRERDEKRALYLHAVGLAVEAVKSGEMSARQAAKIYNIGKSSVYKGMAVRELSAAREMVAADFELAPPHDPETGEITQNAAPQACVDDGSALTAAEHSDVVPRHCTPQAAGPEGGEGTGTHSDDDLTIPPFLDRRAGDAAVRAARWAATGKAGTSSRAIMGVMTGAPPDNGYCYPHDDRDLGRCLGLLAAVPEWRGRMDEMRAVGPEWSALVDHWDELVELHRAGGAYKRMQEILSPIEDKRPGLVKLGDGMALYTGAGAK